MEYTTTLEPLPGTKARVPVPFDPDEVWGTKRQHHVGGTIAGVRVRGTIRKDGGRLELLGIAVRPPDQRR